MTLRSVVIVVAMICVGLVCVAVMLKVTGALSGIGSVVGEDSWGHYARGGNFVTASPSVSDNGLFVVYASPQTGRGDIYLAATGPSLSKSRRLTSSPATDLSPRFLPGTRDVVFTREVASCRHVWRVNVKTGFEKQLTFGPVLDDIIDVSPDGNRLLLTRSAVTRGSGRVVNTFILDIDQAIIDGLGAGGNARFWENGDILATIEGNRDRVVRIDLAAHMQQECVVGSLADADQRSGAIVIYGDAVDRYNLDYRIKCFDTTTDAVIDVGKGHDATIYPNGKVLFFSGFDHQARIWDRSSGACYDIVCPQGYKMVPNKATRASVAGISVKRPQSARVDIYVFDSTSESFVRVDGNLP